MLGGMRYLELDTAKRYSVIGLGTWQFGSREWGYGADYDEGEAARIVARARELGVTVFDTAEIYGFGRSERILGRALAASGGCDDVVVASKVFPVWPTAPVVQQRGVASAQRLGVKQIDLYQVHQPNPVISDGRTMRGMRALQDVGVVDEVEHAAAARLSGRTARLGRGHPAFQRALHRVDERAPLRRPGPGGA